jgi:hypothetical protein
LDKKDSGKTKAALPTRTNPSKIELMPMDLPGLQMGNTKTEYTYIKKLFIAEKYIKLTCHWQTPTFRYQGHPYQHTGKGKSRQ